MRKDEASLLVGRFDLPVSFFEANREEVGRIIGESAAKYLISGIEVYINAAKGIGSIAGSLAAGDFKGAWEKIKTPVKEYFDGVDAYWEEKGGRPSIQYILIVSRVRRLLVKRIKRTEKRWTKGT